jgi:hypothetical protein
MVHAKSVMDANNKRVAVVLMVKHVRATRNASWAYVDAQLDIDL